MKQARAMSLSLCKSMTTKLLATALIAVPMAGCTVMGPNYHRPVVTMPTHYRAQITPAESASIANLPWWGVFDDRALQMLIYQALTNNYDLQVAVARIEQARQQVAIVASEGKPQLNYQLFLNGQKAVVPEPHGHPGTVTWGTLGGVLDAAWEFDVWGRIKRSTEQAQATLLQQEDVRRGVMLTLVTDLANDYFQLLELDRELEIAKESNVAYRKTLDMFTLRYRAGRDSELPVTRSQALYDASNASISDLTRRIALQENAISVLTGAPPRAIERGQPLTAQVMPATPVGATTDLLQRRPDILAAEHTMVAANAGIGVAVADYFPRIGLSALLGGEGITLSGGSGVFGIWSAALNAAGPIFSGGRLHATYLQRKAFWDETVAQYQKTVLYALKETSDALISQQELVGVNRAQQSQVAALRHSVDLALIRYDAGRASYFEVLEAQQQQYDAEYDLSRTQRDQLIAVVNLYKALGGGWSLTPEQWKQPGTTTAAATPAAPVAPTASAVATPAAAAAVPVIKAPSASKE
jgi:multidrug efflux system outer membrane protein